MMQFKLMNHCFSQLMSESKKNPALQSLCGDVFATALDPKHYTKFQA